MTFVQIANNIRYDIAESVGRNYLPSVLIYRTHDIGPTSRLKQCWKYMFQFPSHNARARVSYTGSYSFDVLLAPDAIFGIGCT